MPLMSQKYQNALCSPSQILRKHCFNFSWGDFQSISFPVPKHAPSYDYIGLLTFLSSLNRASPGNGWKGLNWVRKSSMTT